MRAELVVVFDFGSRRVQPYCQYRMALRRRQRRTVAVTRGPSGIATGRNRVLEAS
jgi:hypothetical protein